MIIGILAASASYGIKMFIRERQVEAQVVLVWKELMTLRAKALKRDCWFFVTFDATRHEYHIFRDDNANRLLDAPPADRNAKEPDSVKIHIGFSTPAPTIGPDNTVAGGAAIEGNWTTAIEVRNDNIASISSGRIFFNNPDIPRICYCIQIAINTNNFRLFKWNGSTWREL